MRILRYTVLLLAIVLWGSGLSTTLSHWLYGVGVIAEDYRFGDLYRLSCLPQFKQAAPVCPKEHRSSDTASAQLYILGDSFTEPQRISQSDFQVSHYQRVSWNQQTAGQFQLNPGKRNILLIETVERHFRQHFTTPIVEFTIQKDTSRAPGQLKSLTQQIASELHRTDVEERLESTLFSHNWAYWFKELKASLTLSLFERTNTKVSLSGDKKNIFTYMDTDTTNHLVSSFAPLSDRDVSILVDTLNARAAYYQKLGFDEVYFSIIPNKASILETQRTDYNHLIERIQQDPHLKANCLDVYTPFKHFPTSPYLKSDTHWTCEGQAIWLKLVQQRLRI